jgi:predicted membrane channel-forming protein YqfA (hemolysin III family)
LWFILVWLLACMAIFMYSSCLDSGAWTSEHALTLQTVRFSSTTLLLCGTDAVV